MMEPIVFHPGGNDNKPKMESSTRPVDIVNNVPAKSPAQESVPVPKFDDVPPESHHKEVVPSLAIPDGTPGKNLKRRAFIRSLRIFLVTYVLATAAGITTVTLMK
jgi:hypothetical protein